MSAAEQDHDKLIKIQSIIEDIYGDSLHKKRQLSLSYAALGLLSSESLFLHHMAEGLVKSRGVKKKHATKQIDRLLSNKGICVSVLSKCFIQSVIGDQKDIVVALDWSSFFDDAQTMLSLNLVTEKGMSIPLLWKSVEKTRLKYNRAHYEDELLTRFKESLPTDVQVLLLADRGFADKNFLRFLDEELGFSYIIRMKSNTTVTQSKKQIKYRLALLSDLKGQPVTCQNRLYLEKNPAGDIHYCMMTNNDKLHDGLITLNDLKEVPKESFMQLDNENLKSFEKIKTHILAVTSRIGHTQCTKASHFLKPNGQAQILKDVTLTKDQYKVKCFVAVQEKKG